jgi:hypothetical protein
LEQNQFYLRMPEFTTGHADASLTTDLGNQEASRVWEGQLCLAVWDGTLWFLFEHKGSQFHGWGFEMLATSCSIVALIMPSLLSYCRSTMSKGNPSLSWNIGPDSTASPSNLHGARL